jgi:hypothetical protein
MLLLYVRFFLHHWIADAYIKRIIAAIFSPDEKPIAIFIFANIPTKMEIWELSGFSFWSPWHGERCSRVLTSSEDTPNRLWMTAKYVENSFSFRAVQSINFNRNYLLPALKPVSLLAFLRIVCKTGSIFTFESSYSYKKRNRIQWFCFYVSFNDDLVSYCAIGTE